MQKNHPDKAGDDHVELFKQMKQCSDWIKSGIPLPTPTHKVNEQVTLNNSWLISYFEAWIQQASAIHI